MVLSIGLAVPVVGVSSVDYIRIQRAALMSRAGDFNGAVQYLSEAVAQSPENRVLKARLADALYDAKRYADAQKIYQELLESAEKSDVPDLWYNLGNTAYHRGDYQTAIALYRRKLVEHPDDQVTKRNLELAIQQSKTPSIPRKPQTPPPPRQAMDSMLNTLDQLEQQARQNRDNRQPARRPVDKDW